MIAVSWFTRYGWDRNPFTVLPDPHYMTGFEEIREQLAAYVSSNSLCLLTGATGAGKTTVLLWLKRYGLKGYRPVYINGLDYRDVDLKRLSGRMRLLLDRALRRKSRVVLLVDECQNIKPGFAEAIKARWDMGHIFSVVFASIDERLENLTPSMRDRVGYRKVRLAESCPWVRIWRAAWRNLIHAPPFAAPA